MAKKQKAKRERRERIFDPASAGNPLVVRLVGALGAIGMGAGAYGQWGNLLTEGLEPYKHSPWILAGGALLLGGAIWFGTSGESALRVGDPGIAVQQSRGLRRMPWRGVERIQLGSDAVTVIGKDELGASMEIRASLKGHPHAAAWILKEARERIPEHVEAPAEGELPKAYETAGELVKVEPLQMVGRKCAASRKTIAYEPDARLCRRCERVYHKAHVPETCDCGMSLAGLRAPSEKTKAAAEEEPATEAAAGEAS